MGVPPSPRALSAYERFLTAHALPLWWQPDWLEAAAVESNGDWDVAVLEEDDAVLGVWPYAMYRKGPFTVLGEAPLCPRLGPALAPLDGHSASQLIERRRRLDLLREQLPPYSHLQQRMLPEFEGEQALRWAGYRQTSRTNYVLPTASLEAAYGQLHGSLRRRLSGVGDRLQVYAHGGLLAFWQLNEKTFAQRGQRVPYSYDLLAGVDAVAEARGLRRMLFAANAEGALVAAVYLIWDARAVTCLASGYDAEQKDSSAVALLIWRGIELAHRLGLPFDFEGSDLEGVSEFFARFGGRIEPYHELWHTPSRAYRWLQFIRQEFATR